jgi:hypothetical protein
MGIDHSTKTTKPPSNHPFFKNKIYEAHWRFQGTYKINPPKTDDIHLTPTFGGL